MKLKIENKPFLNNKILEHKMLFLKQFKRKYIKYQKKSIQKMILLIYIILSCMFINEI